MLRYSCVVSVGIVLVLAAVASGQITWEADVQASAAAFYTPGGMATPGSFTATPTANGFVLTGDTIITADPNGEASWYQQMWTRSFTVTGPLPVAATGEVYRDLKIAVGGGDELAIASINVGHRFFEVGYPNIDIDALTGEDSTQQTGNGYLETGLETTLLSDPYVLSPGITYAVGLNIQLSLSAQPVGQPTLTGTWEFGEITTYHGFEWSLNDQVVPEPATLIVLGVAVPLLLTARRSPGRKPR